MTENLEEIIGHSFKILRDPNKQYQQRARQILDALPAAIYTTDQFGLLQYFNPAAVKFSGRVPELGSDRWCVGWRLYYPDGRPMRHDGCPMAVALKEGRAIRGAEAIVERPDGTRLWFESYPTPLWNADGKIIGGVNMLLDITERKRGEEGLRKNEDEFADFFEHAPIPIHCVGPDGVILKANQAELSLLGYSAAEYIGHHVSEFHVDQANIEHMLRRLTAGEELRNYESRLRCKDGSTKDVLIDSNVHWENGQFIHTRCFTRDITEREQAARTTNRLASIVDSSDDAIISKDLNGFITTWNGGAERLFGYTAEEAIGRSVTMLIPPEYLAEEPGILNRIRQGERVDHYETVRRRKDGALIHVSLTVSPILDSEGRVVGASKIARDISTQMKARAAIEDSERRLQEWNRALEAQVAERTAELREQTVRLRGLAAELTTVEQRERKRLAALLHDDLQQLLVAAKMQFNRLGPRIRDGSAAAELQKAGRMIDEALEAARGLTRQLRPPALYEDGLMAALQGLGAEMFSRYGLRIHLSGADPLNSLNDDVKALLFECIRELLFNAAKHAGVEDIEVEINSEAEVLRILVQDSGLGFDPADTKSSHNGGFGLFSVRERLTSLGGSLTMEPREEGGTRATILLPLAADGSGARESENGGDFREIGAEEETELGELPEHHRARVLLVDDHAVVREGIATILEGDERVQVVGEAVDGVDALEAIGKRHPDIVLLDVNMPRMNGIEAAREIHRHWPKIGIVGLSVSDDEATEKSMLAAGASAFLTKSSDSNSIITTILNVMRN